jgi:hypothetical protein
LLVYSTSQCQKIELDEYDSCRTEGYFESGFEMVSDIDECSSGWHPPDPDEDPFGNDFADPRDDPEFDCNTTGGSGSGSEDDPNRDGGDDRECGRLDDDCNEREIEDPSEPEPCVDTDDKFLDDLSFQNIIAEAAMDSGIDELNEDLKIEGFYAIRIKNGILTKELIPYSNRTSCTYDISSLRSTASCFSTFL